jgi:hypothetical protein
MLGDSNESSCFQLDALLTKCRAGVDTYDTSQGSTCSRLRTVLYELHQAVYLFDKHKGDNFTLESCLTIFNCFVAGLPDILEALNNEFERQSNHNLANDQLSVQGQNPDELTLAQILEKLEYYNFCAEIVSTPMARYGYPTSQSLSLYLPTIMIEAHCN